MSWFGRLGILLKKFLKLSGQKNNKIQKKLLKPNSFDEIIYNALDIKRINGISLIKMNVYIQLVECIV
jgi:hypothetical protein